ncbi:MAG: PaaI family thioesterase [Bacteroidales bacterium]|nr:PaaI family thioesterase [Bacteroidales bacterium]
MLHKIKSPFLDKENYNCVACSPNNPNGLHLQFYENGDYVETIFSPDRNTEGWYDTMHGGIQSLIADEVAAWYVMRKLQTSGVTSKLEVQFLKPVLISESPLTARAILKEQKRNLAFISVEIINAKSEVCTKATAVYYCWSKEKAKDEFGFNGCVLEE